MRLPVFLTLLLLAPAANAANALATVFQYECKHARAGVNGFTCQVEDGLMRIHLTKDPKQQTEEVAERIAYDVNALLVRYYNWRTAAGEPRTFYMTADHWEQGRKKYCYFTKGVQGAQGRPHVAPYGWGCQEVTN